MALTKCTVPDNVIGSLGTTAQERGLTTQEFKNKFDEIPEGIKEYINNVLTTELDNYIADYMSHKADSTSYWGFITHDLSVAGTQEVRGVGFKPKTIIIIGIIPGSASYSIGLVGVNDQSTVVISSAIWHERWRAIHIDSGSGGSGSAGGQIVNLTDDGFDINWTIDGTPVGAGTMAFLALNF